MTKTFLIMAGGTGGHVYPALATARKLQAQGHDVVWLGSIDSFEERVVAQNEIPFFGLSIKGLRGKGLVTLIGAPLKLVRALIQAMRVIREVEPACVLGMGGFASGPGGLAARLLGKPLVIHEQNAVAGMTNKLLAKVATKVFEAFPHSFHDVNGVECIGNPIRDEIVELFRARTLKEKTEIDSRKARVLIVGGSLGALKLNQVIPEAMALLPEELRPEVCHQTGKGKFDETAKSYQDKALVADVKEYIEDMAEAYSWADLVICRAGALTVSELCAAGVGAILVPYPHAVDDHQTKNAQTMVEAGAAWLVPQVELSADSLVEMLQPLLSKTERISRLARAALKIAKPDAADCLARECGRLAHV